MEERGMAPVGAYRLAYTSMGSGSPLVVLEAAGGTPRATWNQVMPAIAGFTRAISYDRGSLGESERAGLTGVYVDDPEHDWEGIDFFACADQARETGGFGDLPLVVITAGNHAKDVEDPGNAPGVVPESFGTAFQAMWDELQVDLTRLSTRGRQVIAHESGHYVQGWEPELVIGIIQEMVAEFLVMDRDPHDLAFHDTPPIISSFFSDTCIVARARRGEFGL